MTITAERYHDFCAGHRVVGHEGKCRHLHGHNYRVHFEVVADKTLDTIGRVVDFSVIKSKLCQWLEDNWDHKFIYWNQDPIINKIIAESDQCTPSTDILEDQDFEDLNDTFVEVDFNPTAENLAKYLVEVVAPAQFSDMGITLIKCKIEETRKCTATFYKE